MTSSNRNIVTDHMLRPQENPFKSIAKLLSASGTKDTTAMTDVESVAEEKQKEEPKDSNDAIWTLMEDVSRLDQVSRACVLAESYGTKFTTVTWEDTARTKGSCWGPNISDMTLFAVGPTSVERGQGAVGRNMCVVRRPNFADVSADVLIEKFKVTVGNENGSAPRRIPFKEYLQDIAKYTGNDKLKSMYLPRDEKILISPQYCILPMRHSECEFNSRLFNYQSTPEESAVLVVIASAQGTSAQVLTGKTQSLFFNANGQACNWLTKRLKQDRIERGKTDLTAKMDKDEQERNCLFIYQIPLKLKPKPRAVLQYGMDSSPQLWSASATSFGGNSFGGGSFGGGSFGGAYPKFDQTPSYSFGGASTTSFDAPKSFGDNSDYEQESYNSDQSFQAMFFGSPAMGAPVLQSLSYTPQSRSVMLESARKAEKPLGLDHAMLMVGKPHSKFEGTKNRALERDPNFPIRCTAQFYEVTDTTDLPEAIFKEINDKIKHIYDMASASGSLVLDGDTGRVTEPNLQKSTNPAVPMAFPVPAGPVEDALFADFF